MSSTRAPRTGSTRTHKIVLTEDEQFFYDHAGYAHGMDEPSWSGRVRCAVLLADAEAALNRATDVHVEWEHDPEPWDGDVEWDGSVWMCAVIRDGVSLASLCGIACSDGDPYMRVVAAELASEAHL